jgi:aspartate aminotransferase-like enzyme
MPGLLSDIDPNGLLEYSVVYTDRALNHMSARFQGVMRGISEILKTTYNAQSAIVVPGSGSFGMEAVARQFATGQKCLVLRNGWFSYRWTQILEMGQIPAQAQVLKAQRTETGPTAPFSPAPLQEVLSAIRNLQPAVVFAPHVETASGMMLPNAYLQAVSEAVHAVGGIFVLDCIASGAIWVDMAACGVDVLISAPQKGWSGSPCCAFVMLSPAARERIEHTTSTSFACDLRKWLQIMETYESGGHAYHATLPTDALTRTLAVMQETQSHGLPFLRQAQQNLGDSVRSLMVKNGFPSVAAPGFQAPGVVVSYTTDPDIHTGKKFMAVGLQTAAGVPLQCDEGADYRSFRIGLFGLDKLLDVDATVARLASALKDIQR